MGAVIIRVQMAERALLPDLRSSAVTVQTQDLPEQHARQMDVRMSLATMAELALRLDLTPLLAIVPTLVTLETHA
jgi:hypothetical protein